ncbi:GFA family protein [Methylobacter sp. YRD-M1]|uniref:GFA family protein n=1 Tax=Methylobacter sp. YRD-M1 TaxID=2911520 RepID=UPI00227ADD98|nr:GFA family protein [Methylobacter sp. YRD-M1]WAK02469.1 GFA family protein [Methylobacter sp. YRD-M1]
MNSLKGQCLCGSVQYEIKGEPQLSFLCQCRQCQRITGAGHSAEFVVPDEIVSLSGELKSYEMKSDNGNIISSEFCPNCGNPVLKKSSGYPGLLFFHAATLENPESFKPQRVFWASSSQPWDFVDPSLEVKQKA